MKYKICRWIGFFVSGWLEMLGGIVTILTFCIYRPFWNAKFRWWITEVLVNMKPKREGLDIFEEAAIKIKEQKNEIR
jgi:hypothetical protein